MKNYEKCDCGKIAVWLYMPGMTDKNSFYCDMCVPRGCSCNHNYVVEFGEPLLEDGVENIDWKYSDDRNYWYHIDEKDREYPCCEFDYDEDGYEIYSEEERLKFEQEIKKL